VRSPIGWIVSGYLYDRYEGLPPTGSPWETVFLIVYRERQRAEVLSVKAQVQSLILILQQLGASSGGAKPAIQAYEAYTDQMLPVEQNAEISDDHKRLRDFVKYKGKIDTRSILQTRVAQGKQKAENRARRLRPRKPR
jgi:hypothetical protein